ncbi:fluoride efflux transporter FluC [Prochlorococcus marinus]|uniref:fluoride efflux transporter FluC n=1 Tax=Prochlorococcus marinus TaxID=1219 RepID=UPI0022B4A732|nr:CrcB family protein [Prochlorococcus marinus]
MASILGALLRWKLGNDFLANIFGASLIGLLSGLEFRSNIQIFLGIGFCGALTTYSGWMVDVWDLMRNGFFLKAFALLSVTLIVGFLAFAIAFWIGRKTKQSFFP